MTLMWVTYDPTNFILCALIAGFTNIICIRPKNSLTSGFPTDPLKWKPTERAKKNKLFNENFMKIG